MIKVGEFNPGKPLSILDGLAGATLDARIVFSNDLLAIPVETIVAKVFKTKAQELPGLQWEIEDANLATPSIIVAEAVEDTHFRRCVAFRLDLAGLNAKHGDFFLVQVILNGSSDISKVKASISCVVQVFDYSSRVI